MTKRILTIQDISCVGQCSLTVALPVISACGVEAAILPGSVLSTHTGGFTGFTFKDLTEEMPKIRAHWEKEGISFDAVYTGYLSETQIPQSIDIIDSCARKGAPIIVDPAMADNGKLYYGFGEDFPSKMAKLCAKADYVLPNITEAAYLTGNEIILSGYDEKYIDTLLKGLVKLGAKNALLTGVSFDEKSLGIALYDGKRTEFYFNERINKSLHGTGDIYASVFTGALMRGVSPIEAAALGADFVVECIKNTPDSHSYGACFEPCLPMLDARIKELLG